MNYKYVHLFLQLLICWLVDLSDKKIEKNVTVFFVTTFFIQTTILTTNLTTNIQAFYSTNDTMNLKHLFQKQKLKQTFISKAKINTNIYFNSKN